jgi:hypothetical protein
MTDFKMIPLKDIHPDSNQPRRIYDQASMDELTQSVKEKGILQPILTCVRMERVISSCVESEDSVLPALQASLIFPL